MARRDDIRKALLKLDDEDLVKLYNDECIADGYPQDMLYHMSEFNTIMHERNLTAWEIVNTTHRGSFDPNDDWFWIEDYNDQTHSTDWISTGEEIRDDLPIDMDLLADYVDRLWSDEDIKELLDN